MAAADPVQSLTEEASCPICLEFYKDPVTTECGHNFCRSCISRYWEAWGAQPLCPQCRETCATGNLKPNRQLQSMVEITKELALQSARAQEQGARAQKQNLCLKHEEKLKLFCHEHATPICVVCSLSAEHRGHTVAPIEEAALQYKGEFQSFFEDMRSKLENILGCQQKEEAKLSDLEVNFKIQRERITSVFNKAQQFLEKEKCHHLSNLEEKEKRSLQRIREKVTKLHNQQMMVRGQITEMESKRQLADVELLKDVKSILSRFEKMKCQYPDSEHFKIKVKETESKKDEGKEKNEEAKYVEHEEDLVLKIIESLEWRCARSYSCEVALDPGTAHRRLVLSEDRRSVRDEDRAQLLPDTPERFDYVINVLGRERLSSGRHYWEVEVGDKTAWDLGVCDETESRKGAITFSRESGSWAVWLKDGKYEAFSSPRTPLTPSVPPRVVGLFLDYEAGRFSVYNVTDRSLLFTFSGASFPRTLRAFFNPGLRDVVKNATPLRVLPVTGQE